MLIIWVFHVLCFRVPWDFGVHDLRAVLYNACSPRWRDFRAIHLLSRHRLDGVKPGDGRPISFNEENIKSYKKTFGEMARCGNL